MNAEAIVRYEEAKRQLQAAREIHISDQEVVAAARAQHAVARRLQDPRRPVAVIDIRRNQPCPCGSGVKFKKCCGT